MLHTIKLLGVSITNETEEKVLESVLLQMQNHGKKLFIITPNPEILMYAQAHPDYQDKLNTAEVALPDGVGLLWASKILGKSLKSRITGVDFIEKLCQESREKPLSIGFLGGRGGVAEKAAHRLVKKYPWLRVTFLGEEWGEEGFKQAEVFRMKYMVYGKEKNIQHTTYNIQNTDIDILFVAFGFPKQEEWIYKNLQHLPVKAAMGVGGAFDYLSGNVTRAPKLVQKVGLEWLFRLIRQPWRIKRQLALIKFIRLVLKEKRRTK
jgi:N-acetylglucosaminyldiphosphoundecaprenol N-acetyl-beta-D-mannosaminyltransferase